MNHNASPLGTYRVAIVTGASRGIGRSLAIALAKQGTVVGLLARNANELRELVGTIEQAGGCAMAAPCDVTDRQQVLAAVRQVSAAFGPIDLLIANAGISMPFSVKRFDGDKAKALWDVNVNGAVYSMEAVVKDMLARGHGHIVGISSMASYVAIPGHGAYCASKAALSTLLSSMRGELEHKGVFVTTVCPGYIKTDMTDKNNYTMPFMMELDEATRIIMRGLAKRRRVINFPWQMRCLTLLLKIIPMRVQRLLLPKRAAT